MDPQAMDEQKQTSSVGADTAISPPAAADPMQQEQSDLQSDTAASQLRKSGVIATSDFVMSINHPHLASQLALLAHVDWTMIDVNLTLPNGLSLHSSLVTALRAAASLTFVSHAKAAAMTAQSQQSIIAKLLEYAPTASSLQPSQPRDADELLQWMAIELAPSCGAWLLPFIQLLLTSLQQRGFDLDRRDATGRTLLTAYAAMSQEPTAEAVARHLMRLGADASVPGKDGRSAIYMWTEQFRTDLLEQLLVGRPGSFAGLQQQIDLWQRDANGRSLRECMQCKGDSFRISATVLGVLQQHWAVCERPLLQRILTSHAALILDLARLTLDYLDGGAASSFPAQLHTSAVSAIVFAHLALSFTMPATHIQSASLRGPHCCTAVVCSSFVIECIICRLIDDF